MVLRQSKEYVKTLKPVTHWPTMSGPTTHGWLSKTMADMMGNYVGPCEYGLTTPDIMYTLSTSCVVSAEKCPMQPYVVSQADRLWQV